MKSSKFRVDFAEIYQFRKQEIPFSISTNVWFCVYMTFLVSRNEIPESHFYFNKLFYLPVPFYMFDVFNFIHILLTNV